MPPKKLECYTKTKKDGGKYTTCTEGQKAPVKTKRLVKKEAPKKPEPVRASGTAKRVKAKDTEKGKADALRDARNKMSPLELFGQLPALAKLNILKPSVTGVKVGGPTLGEYLKRNLNEARNYLSEANFRNVGRGGSEVIDAIKDSVFYGKGIDIYDSDDERKATDVKLMELGLYGKWGFKFDVLDKYMKNKSIGFPIDFNTLPKKMKNIVPDMIKAYFEVIKVKKGDVNSVKKELETLFTKNINRSKESAGVSKTDLEYRALKKKHPNTKLTYYFSPNHRWEFHIGKFDWED